MHLIIANYCLRGLLTIYYLCDMQTACLQLMNAIVSTPDELDFRLHLRNEFLRYGLSDALQVSSLEFNVPFQHKYGYIRDDRTSGTFCIKCFTFFLIDRDNQATGCAIQHTWCRNIT